MGSRENERAGDGEKEKKIEIEKRGMVEVVKKERG